MELAERMQAAVAAIGTKKEAAAATGIGVSTLYNYLRLDPMPPLSFLEELAVKSDVSREWLFFGKGEMKIGPIDVVEREIERNRQALFGDAPARREPVEAKRLGDTYDVPIRDVVVAAGAGGAAVSDRILGSLTFPTWLLRNLGQPTNLELVPIVGDSMEPDLRDGDLALIDTSLTDRVEGMLVLVVEGRLVAKRLRNAAGGMIELVSSNPAYPPVPVDPRKEQLIIVGRIVWAGKNFR